MRCSKEQWFGINDNIVRYITFMSDKSVLSDNKMVPVTSSEPTSEKLPHRLSVRSEFLPQIYVTVNNNNNLFGACSRFIFTAFQLSQGLLSCLILFLLLSDSYYCVEWTKATTGTIQENVTTPQPTESCPSWDKLYSCENVYKSSWLFHPDSCLHTKNKNDGFDVQCNPPRAARGLVVSLSSSIISVTIHILQLMEINTCSESNIFNSLIAQSLLSSLVWFVSAVIATHYINSFWSDFHPQPIFIDNCDYKLNHQITLTLIEVPTRWVIIFASSWLCLVLAVLSVIVILCVKTDSDTSRNNNPVIYEVVNNRVNQYLTRRQRRKVEDISTSTPLSDDERRTSPISLLGHSLVRKPKAKPAPPGHGESPVFTGYRSYAPSAKAHLLPPVLGAKLPGDTSEGKKHSNSSPSGSSPITKPDLTTTVEKDSRSLLPTR